MSSALERYGDMADRLGMSHEQPVGISYTSYVNRSKTEVPSVTDHLLNELIKGWLSGKMSDRVVRFENNVYAFHGTRLDVMKLAKAKWRYRKPFTMARVDRKDGVLEAYGKYARWGDAAFPNDWEKIQSRLRRVARNHFNHADAKPYAVLNGTLRPRMDVCPVYSLHQGARHKAGHAANATAYDGLLLLFNNKLKRAKRHKRFYLNAYTKVVEEAREYEDIHGVDLGIIIRKEYILESFRRKLG